MGNNQKNNTKTNCLLKEDTKKEQRVKTILLALNTIYGTSKKDLQEDFSKFADTLYKFFGKTKQSKKILIFLYNILENHEPFSELFKNFNIEDIKNFSNTISSKEISNIIKSLI